MIDLGKELYLRSDILDEVNGVYPYSGSFPIVYSDDIELHFTHRAYWGLVERSLLND